MMRPSSTHTAGYPAGFEAELERFRIVNPFEIERILQTIAKRATLVSLHLPDAPWFLLTTLIAAERERGTICLEFGRDEEINGHVLKAQELRVDTYLDQINIRFAANDLRARMLLGQSVIECAFPSSLLRLQRREFFRIAPPLNQPIVITVQLPQPFAEKDTLVEARGIDISCGGVVFLVTGDFESLPVGTRLRGVILQLPNVARLEADLEVRNTRFVERAGQVGTTRIGCRFLSLDARAAAQLQRYINRLEIERRIGA